MLTITLNYGFLSLTTILRWRMSYKLPTELQGSSKSTSEYFVMVCYNTFSYVNFELITL